MNNNKNEEKWREEFELSRYGLSDINTQDSDYLYGLDTYLSACRERDAEIEKLKGMYDVISKREQVKNAEIVKLKDERDFKSSQLITRDVVFKDEIQSLKSLIAQARPWVIRLCGENRGELDLKREWLEKTAGIK